MPACLNSAIKAVYLNARVAELVDALDLGSSAVRRESSSLSFRTKYLEAFLDRKAFFVPGASSLAEKLCSVICLQKPNML